jgi:hypothetical protein
MEFIHLPSIMVYKIFEPQLQLRSHGDFSLHCCANYLCYHSLSIAQKIIFIFLSNFYILFFVSIEKQTMLCVFPIVVDFYIFVV